MRWQKLKNITIEPPDISVVSIMDSQIIGFRNPLDEFIAVCLSRDTNWCVWKWALYMAYEKFCQIHELPPLTSAKFNRLIRKKIPLVKYCPTIRKTVYNSFRGVRFNSLKEMEVLARTRTNRIIGSQIAGKGNSIGSKTQKEPKQSPVISSRASLNRQIYSNAFGLQKIDDKPPEITPEVKPTEPKTTTRPDKSLPSFERLQRTVDAILTRCAGCGMNVVCHHKIFEIEDNLFYCDSCVDKTKNGGLKNA